MTVHTGWYMRHASKSCVNCYQLSCFWTKEIYDENLKPTSMGLWINNNCCSNNNKSQVIHNYCVLWTRVPNNIQINKRCSNATFCRNLHWNSVGFNLHITVTHWRKLFVILKDSSVSPTTVLWTLACYIISFWNSLSFT